MMDETACSWRSPSSGQRWQWKIPASLPRLVATLCLGLISIQCAHATATDPAVNPIVSAVHGIDSRYLYASRSGWRAAREQLLNSHPGNEAAAFELLARTLDQLRDPDLHLLSPSQFAALQTETAGSRMGFGLIDFAIDSDVRGRPRIVTPLSGSPADLAGLRAGDIIIGINGNSVRGLSHEQVLDRLRTRGTLGIEVARGRRSLRVRLRSSNDPLRPVRSSMIRLPTISVGYLRVSQFTPGTANQVESVLRHQPAAAFVLDLRNNPGGLLDEAADVVGLFRRTNLGMKRRANGMVEPISTKRSPNHEVPIAILINRGTASAAEFVAATLHESSGVALIGSPTAARGQAQLYLPLANGWGIVVPSARLITAGGRDLKEHPLTPDVLVSGNSVSSEDQALKRALRLLRRETTGSSH